MEETVEHKHCCPQKQYYSQNANTFDTLQISPRAMLCKKPLRVHTPYQQLITVKNVGTYPRSIKCHTDSPVDTTLHVYNLRSCQYLMPGSSVNILVTVKPVKKVDINRTRTVFLNCEHPNVKIEIPIIVQKQCHIYFTPLHLLLSRNDNVHLYREVKRLRATKLKCNPEVLITYQRMRSSSKSTAKYFFIFYTVILNDTVVAYPTTVQFPSSVAKMYAYYEFIVYNATQNKTAFKIRTVDSALKIMAASSKILHNNFVQVKLKLHIKNSNVSRGTMKFRFGNITNNIIYEHHPKKVSLYMSTKYITFGETTFNREVKKKLTICNESKVPIPYDFDIDENFTHLAQSHALLNLLSNDSMENSYMTLETANDIPATTEFRDSKSFRINPKNGELAPHFCTELEITFKPLFKDFEMDELTLPPFKMISELILNSTLDEICGSEYVVMEASIKGPEMFLSMKTFDFRSIYMGEECCDHIKVTNNDDTLQCKVKFHDYSNMEMAKIYIDPVDGFDLKPGESGVFKFIFFAIAVGRIYSRLRFTIQNGGYISTVIRATSVQVQVKTHPPIVSFGSIPFGVPQKRSVLLMNPLSTPLSVQLFLKDNGSEIPFVLKIDDVRELPPITIQNPIEKYVNHQNEDEISCYRFIEDEENRSEDERSSLNSVRESDELTIRSETFDTEVLATLPRLAFELLHNIKNKRIVEKNEPEVRVVQEVTDQLLKLSYFKDLKTHNNYALMDWNYLPSDPMELYFDTEVIHLRPNAGHSVTILIIPNSVGCFNRSIDVRCCPHSLICSNESEEQRMIVDSDLVTTRLSVTYACDIPKLEFNNEIVMNGKIYAGQTYDFDMEFKNLSRTCGFFHFAVVPDCDGGFMGFRSGIFKFFIRHEETKIAECEVEYRKIGHIKLTGLIKIVGNLLPLPFHITANILPAEVSIQPMKLSKRQVVLEKRIYYFYIDNITPTITKIRLSLRNESTLILNPRGSQLSPGQGLYVSLIVKYPDPEIYKNILYVDMLYGEPMKIPLTFDIAGVPIFFDPELRNNLEIGPVVMSTEFEYGARNEMFSKPVQVWNRGERPYSITFNKLKAKQTSSGFCEAEILKAQISITPKTIEIRPGEKCVIFITAVSCQKVILYNEFSCTIVDLTNPMRFTSFKFSVTVEFTGAQILWRPKQITMNFDRTHAFDQKQQIEMAKLVNLIEAPVKNVLLKVYGPFLIRTVYEKPFSKDVQLNLGPNEEIEVWITLDEKKLRDTAHSFMKGKIFCYTNFKLQKCLPLRVDIKYPDIIITQPDLVIFTTDKEDHIEVQLENVGLLDARYTWKKLGECKNYIADFDDYAGLAREILTDILNMFDLHEVDNSINDVICQENLMLCYQKYRCALAAIEDPDKITDIVNEIINNLDLEHCRYKIELSSDMDIFEIEEEQEEINESRSRMVVRNTFDEILNKLKLEDNYELSEESQDECGNEELIYFVEKTGMVPGHQAARTLVHLPPVKNGYEHVGCFLLDVFGGHQQKLLITAVNLPRVVDICPRSIYLGVQPWYEPFRVNFRAINSTQFKVNIRVKDMPHPIVGDRRRYYLINGFASILGSRIFFLNPYSSHRIKSEGIMGFSSEYIREFQLTVNDRLPTKFSLRGQGIMPILLAIHNNIPRTKDESHLIKKEYELLQRVYYFNMFKEINIEDEEMETQMEEEEGKKSLKEITFSKISIFTVSDVSDETDSELVERVERNWEKLLSTYIVVYNNESVPHASLLEQLLATERFIDMMNEDPHKRNILQHKYREYFKSQARIELNPAAVNLKYFTVQPLPFEQWGYIIEMKNLKLSQFRKYDIDLQFFGPGKLTASARTAIRIPGLYVHFEIRSKCGQEFQTYRAEEKMPDYYSKRYRNMFQREIDAEGDLKLKHAHSYDCEERCKFHKRDITNRDRAEVKNYYNSLNKYANIDFKHHFINCTIYHSSRDNSTGIILRINILIKLDPKYYKEGQLFEDFLYIDLHMGPTLPILLRGLIK